MHVSDAFIHFEFSQGVTRKVTVVFDDMTRVLRSNLQETEETKEEQSMEAQLEALRQSYFAKEAQKELRRQEALARGEEPPGESGSSSSNDDGDLQGEEVDPGNNR